MITIVTRIKNVHLLFTSLMVCGSYIIIIITERCPVRYNCSCSFMAGGKDASQWETHLSNNQASGEDIHSIHTMLRELQWQDFLFPTNPNRPLKHRPLSDAPRRGSSESLILVITHNAMQGLEGVVEETQRHC